MSQPLLRTVPASPDVVRGRRLFDDSRLATLQRLARTADRESPFDEHIERVGRTAALLAERMGWSESDVELIRHAAPLHDIGKLAVADAILLKTGALTSQELHLMRRHVTSGAAMLSGSASDVIRLAREIALTHHEWWDGSGYPEGLSGETIPLCGRIVALADVFDALTHERPYKSAWPVDDAVAEIRRLSGRQFDPSVVEAFEKLDVRDLV